MQDNDFNDDKVNTVDIESGTRAIASQIRRYALIGFGLVILNFAYVMVTVPHGIINGGVTIGHDAAIGAGSVVTKDIPAGVVAAGVPCRVIRPLTEEDAMYGKAPNEAIKPVK